MIVAATPREATDALRVLMQAAVSCVTPRVVTMAPVPPAADLAIRDRLLAAGGPANLTLRFRYLLDHDPTRDRRARWQVRTAGYDYRLDGADGREILAYHWHPAGQSHEQRPHLHIGAGFGAIQPAWQKAHLLTGALSPAVVLELCIATLGVPPRRPDWSVVFARLAGALHTPEPAA